MMGNDLVPVSWQTEPSVKPHLENGIETSFFFSSAQSLAFSWVTNTLDSRTQGQYVIVSVTTSVYFFAQNSIACYSFGAFTNTSVQALVLSEWMTAPRLDNVAGSPNVWNYLAEHRNKLVVLEAYRNIASRLEQLEVNYLSQIELLSDIDDPELKQLAIDIRIRDKSDEQIMKLWDQLEETMNQNGPRRNGIRLLVGPG